MPTSEVGKQVLFPPEANHSNKWVLGVGGVGRNSVDVNLVSVTLGKTHPLSTSGLLSGK